MDLNFTPQNSGIPLDGDNSPTQNNGIPFDCDNSQTYANAHVFLKRFLRKGRKTSDYFSKEFVQAAFVFNKAVSKSLERVYNDLKSLVASVDHTITCDYATFTQLFVAMYHMIHTRSQKDFIVNLVHILVTCFRDQFNEHVDYIYSIFRTAIDSLSKCEWPNKGLTYAENSSFERKSLTSLLDTFLESNIVSAFKTLFLQLVALKFFSKETRSKVITWVGKPKACSLLEFAYTMVSCVEQMMDFELAFREKKCFWSALQVNDKVADYLSSTHELLVKAENYYVGSPENFQDNVNVKERACARDLKIEIRNAITIGERLKMELPKKKISSTFEVRLWALKRVDRDIAVKLQSLVRKAPVGIVVTGPPEIGKSSILTRIYRIFAKSQGYIYSQDLIYDRNPISKFWTNHDSQTQPIIHYPELGSIHENIAKMKGDSVVDELLKVCDSQPYCAEMAVAEEKGKVYIMPDLVVVDCNDPEWNLKHLQSNPAAIKRRFMYITVSLKDTYKRDNKAGLDVNKIPEDIEYANDLWHFQVYFERPHDAKKSLREYVRWKDNEVLDIFDLTEYLLQYFSKSNQQQTKMTKAVEEPVEKYIRAECGVEYYENYSYTWFATLVVFWTSLLWSFAWFVFSTFRTYQNLKKAKIIFLLRLSRWYGYFCYKTNMHLDGVIANVYYSGTLGYYGLRSFFRKDQLYFEKKAEFFSNSRYRSLGYQMIGLGVFLAACKFTLSLFKVSKVTAESDMVQSTGKFTQDNVDCYMKSVEQRANCAFPEKKKKKGTDQDYDKVENFVPQIVGKQFNTNSFDEIQNRILRNLMFAKVYFPHTESYLNTYVLGVCADYFIVNKHTLRGNPCATMTISREVVGSAQVQCLVTSSNSTEIAPDVLLVRCTGLLCKDLRDCLSVLPDDIRYGVMHGSVGTHKTLVQRVKETINLTSDIAFSVANPYCYSFPHHKNGDCGKPVIAKFNKFTYLLGIHTGGTNTDLCYAAPFSRKNVIEGLALLEKSELLPIMSEGELRLPKDSVLESVTSRSPLLYENTTGLLIAGHISGRPNVAPKSTLVESPIVGYIKDLIGVDPYLPNGSLKYQRPVMKSFRNSDGEFVAPYNNWIKKVSVVKKKLEPHLIQTVVVTLTAYLCKKLRESGVKELSPFPLSVAQNGFPENFYIRAMKNSTSAGLLFPGKKFKHNTDVELDFKKDSKDPNWEVKEQVLEILSAYESEKLAHPFVGAQLKDEPRAYEKALKGKTRVFAMSPYDATLVNRMFLLPFYSMMNEHRDVFFTKVGINMHSAEANDLYNSLKDFSPNIMEGDYGGYDTSMPVDVGVIANTVVYNVLKDFGYNDYSLQMVKGILADNLFPTLVMDGNIFVAPGFQPSGKYATAEDNSLRGVILLLYSFVHMCTEEGAGLPGNLTTRYVPSDFFRLVLPVTYGDDMLCSVKEELPEFNNLSYGFFVEQFYGMEFTTASKDVQEYRYTPIDSTSFLKRTFKYNKILQRYVALLQPDSLVKSLTYVLPSQAVSADVQIIETSAAALRELFFGFEFEEEYTKLREQFASVLGINTCYSKDEILEYFPTWTTLVEQYK